MAIKGIKKIRQHDKLGRPESKDKIAGRGKSGPSKKVMFIKNSPNFDSSKQERAN